jgi:hypothetical protein
MSTPAERRALIEKIRSFPAQLEAVVKDLRVEDLTTHFLPHEWTVAQNVHHLGDSHMNAFIRLKKMLNEDNPALQNYDQDVWAESPEAVGADLTASLLLLKGLHARWAALLDSLQESDWSRTGQHPEFTDYSVEKLLTIYGKHGEGHIEQIKKTLAAKH